MSSGFVSAGASSDATTRDAEWDTAQKEIEAQQGRKKQETNPNDGRSLYEANKAAKQEAFEEATKLKNQFRALDDDEVDFLDAVLESTRAKEQAVQEETSKHLEAFRQQREQADKAAGLGSEPDGLGPVDGEEQWASRKRKKASERAGLKGVKLRKSSSSHGARQTPSHAEPVAPSAAASATATRRIDKVPAQRPAPEPAQQPADGDTVHTKSTESAPVPAPAPGISSSRSRSGTGLGLAAYSDSDED